MIFVQIHFSTQPILVIFRPYLHVEGKSSTQRVHFFDVHLPIENVQLMNFLNQDIANLTKNATEIERFLKYVRNFSF